MPIERNKPSCVLDIAKKVVEDWTGRDEEVSWEDDKVGRAVFAGKCPNDGTFCTVLINIKNGKIDGVPVIKTDNDRCDVNNP